MLLIRRRISAALYGIGYCYAAAGSLCGLKFPVRMRVKPTLTTAGAFKIFTSVESTASWAGLPTFSGSASVGTYRYSASLNGVINVYSSDASYFPGGNAGVTATGGQYA